MSRVRGWCPSAHRPMMSGDGLLVRVRPRLARVTAEQWEILARLATRYGNGWADLTSRGNLQLRGVNATDHDALLRGLIEADLVSEDPDGERGMTVTPLWSTGDLSYRLALALEPVLGCLKELPGKMSVVVDAGARRVLHDVPGDFRFERGDAGLILRADGAEKGWPVPEERAAEALAEMADWFLTKRGTEARRMRHFVRQEALPASWQMMLPADAEAPPSLNPRAGHIGFSYGRARIKDILEIIMMSGSCEARLTPWRGLIVRRTLTDTSVVATNISAAPEECDHIETDISDVSRAVADISGVITDISDRRGSMSVCPGAPDCGQGEVETRKFADQLAVSMMRGDRWKACPDDRPEPGQMRESGDAGLAKSVHISGCTKGCARQSAAEITLVGQNGLFDLVRDGRASDRPSRTGLTPKQVEAEWDGL